MPLIDESTNKCEICGMENSFADPDIRVPDDDEYVFTIDCPGCGACESFMFHDDIAMKQVVEMRPFPADIEGESPETEIAVSWEEPDPEGFDAVHSTLVESVGKRLGRKQKVGLRPPDRPDYPSKPKKPKKNDMRKAVEERIERRKPKEPLDRAKAEATYQAAVVEAKEHAKQRKAEKEAIREAKRKSKYKGATETVIPLEERSTHEVMKKERVDKPKEVPNDFNKKEK